MKEPRDSLATRPSPGTTAVARACVPSGVRHSNTAVSGVLAGERLPARQHGDGSVGPPAHAASRGAAGHHSGAMQEEPGQPPGAGAAEGTDPTTARRGTPGPRQRRSTAAPPPAVSPTEPLQGTNPRVLGVTHVQRPLVGRTSLLRTQPHGPTTTGTRSSGHRGSRPTVCWTHCPQGRRLFPAKPWLTFSPQAPLAPGASSRTYQTGSEARRSHPPRPGWGRQLDGLCRGPTEQIAGQP